MSCTQKRQLVRFPKVRILKQWFRHFNDHKEFHNEGNLHLFSMPAFALEKEALKTEIEAGIQTGVEQMESGQKGKKPMEKYHNTRHLLRQYRKVRSDE